MLRKKLDTEYLYKHFKIDFDGTLRRLYKKRGWQICVPTNSTSGYLRVGLPRGQTVYVHVLAWFLRYGYIPSILEIDHVDGDRTNNAFTNLRLTTRVQNQANRAPNKSGKSRFKGVFKGSKNKWIASLSYKGIRYYLGQFNCETSAALAYNKKAAELKDFYRKVN